MAWDLILWLLTFFIVISLLAVTVYQFVCLADLEIDHINIYDSSARINACVIPEFVIQGTLSAIFLLTWHWFMFLLSVPISYYHIRLYMARKHLIDVTEIFTSLDRDKKYLLVKLGFYLIIFVIVIYRLVETSVTMAMYEEEDYMVHR
ncbi:cornichon-like protein [Thalictrum thalictroides]|uniref:Cornichon-like protein n=1 Tax=Thalictrum thalictroides TaxID=46969 RepID=A0A7J6WC61_THATH|nr:cornichon-like protein [Thalictrum thalictroides]